MLLGSRGNDNAKGGDIDLYVETQDSQATLDKKIKLLTALNLALGEQKIAPSLIISPKKDIYTIARKTGIKL